MKVKIWGGGCKTLLFLTQSEISLQTRVAVKNRDFVRELNGELKRENYTSRKTNLQSQVMCIKRSFSLYFVI